MIFCPAKYQKEFVDINEELYKLQGLLEDKQAKVTLIEFLRRNIGFTVELISGVTLYPYQEIILKAFLNRDFNLGVLARGSGKSMLAAVFCFLYCLFNPGAKIVIAGPTFRTARNIFTELEKFIDNPGAQLIQQLFLKDNKSKRNDMFNWKIGEGSIVAIPLNGEKIRGFRAQVLIVDEFLLMTEEMVETVLMPFLIAPSDIKKRIKIRQTETRLISEGKMKDEDRKIFKNSAKMVALSSASYTFEYLYKKYKEWEEQIYSIDPGMGTYFIAQLSYEALPPDMVEMSVIEQAQNGGQSNAVFQREYCAQFTDGSEGYFSAKKMDECTIKDGDDPCLQLVGEKGKKYIIAIDPSFSNSPSSDFFAIAVHELDEKDKTSTLVHNYGIAGADLKDHIKYFYYLYKSFKPVSIIIDNAGFQFIDGCNESELFIKDKIELSFMETWDSSKQDSEYFEMLKNARKEYNLESGKICIKQVFTSEFICRSNEHLQACIDHKKVFFASRINPSEGAFNKSICAKLDVSLTGHKAINELIDNQDEMVVQVKKQCSLIEVKSTAKGTQTFDLPSHFRRSTSATRARKDNYTALLLGNWAVRGYYDLMDQPQVSVFNTFEPIIIR